MKRLPAAIAALLAACLAAKAQVAPTLAEIEAYSGVHAGVIGGSAWDVQRMVRDGGDVNARDAFGRTPLILAAHRRDISVARALVEAGANVNALDHQSYDAVTIAAVNNDVEMLRLLLSSGGNARAIIGPLGATALINAARHGNAAAVETLVDARAPVEHADYLGQTALLTAVERASEDVRYVMTVKALLHAGADPGRKDGNQRTALDLAKAKALAPIVALLEQPRAGE